MLKTSDEYYYNRGDPGTRIQKIFAWFLSADLSKPLTTKEIAQRIGIEIGSLPAQIQILAREKRIDYVRCGKARLFKLVPIEEWRHWQEIRHSKILYPKIMRKNLNLKDSP